MPKIDFFSQKSFLFIFVKMQARFNFFTLQELLRVGDLHNFKNFVRSHENAFLGRVLHFKHQIIASQNVDILRYVLGEVSPPTFDDIHHAFYTNNVELINVVCKHSSQQTLNESLIGVSNFPPKLIKLLLDHGANPNAEEGAAMCQAAENGRLNVIKLYMAFGGKLDAKVLSSACLRENYEVAFWLYQRGVRGGIESPGFQEFKQAKQIEAQRKIYFWYLRKLMKNKDFLMKQASSRYDALFVTCA